MPALMCRGPSGTPDAIPLGVVQLERQYRC